MPSIVVTMFENELRLNTWYDALETCFYWITPTQYLPENVLRGIVEIMLVNMLLPNHWITFFKLTIKKRASLYTTSCTPVEWRNSGFCLGARVKT